MGLFDRWLKAGHNDVSSSASDETRAEQDATRVLEEGMALEKQGQMDEALRCYDSAIRLMPELARAHFYRGNLLLDRGEAIGALKSYEKALEFKPDSAAAHYNLGTAHLNLGNVESSVESCRMAIALKPDFADAHMLLGMAYEKLGQHDRAVECFSHVVDLKPDFAEAHFQRGISFHALGKFDDAVSSYQSALKIDSNVSAIYCNLGTAFRELERIDDAIFHYGRAIEISPTFVEAHFNLGSALQRIGQLGRAVTCYLNVLGFASDHFDAHVNLGISYRELGRLEDALAIFHKAISLEPKNIAGHLHFGITLATLGRYGSAIEIYQRALEIDPENADVHVSLGNVYKDLGRFEDAFSSIRRALQISPASALAHNNFLFIQNYVGQQPAERLLADAQRFGAMVARLAQPFKHHPNPADSQRALRVGLVSGDLRNHPVGYFLSDVLTALHAQASGEIEIYAYPTVPSDDETSKHLRTCCRSWCLTVGLSDEALARRIKDDRVDILVDLSGHTAHNRLPVFAWKPAPIQMSWLGYCATTGVSEIDYYIADAVALPPALESQFVETIWRLPESYLCLSRPPSETPVSSLPALITGEITFGSFNNLTKMTEETVRLWARVLKAIPGSKLFLKSKHLDDEDVLRATMTRYADHGIGAHRLILEGHIDERSGHLAAYNRVDIALDPFPYNGVTTTAEALWMGVPVLTLAGRRFLERQGMSLLTNAGLPDWIAGDPDDYVARAVAHASNLHSLARLRAGLRQEVLASPVFDATRFARNFEHALWDMWKIWCGKSLRSSGGALDQI